MNLPLTHGGPKLHFEMTTIALSRQAFHIVHPKRTETLVMGSKGHTEKRQVSDLFIGFQRSPIRRTV